MEQLKDHIIDKKLHIRTGGVQSINEATIHYHRYEPTPYKALHLLFEKYPLTKTDRVIDFGCGKGRLNIYSHYLFGCGGVGVEMNQSIHHQAMRNLIAYNHYVKKATMDIIFDCTFAEKYKIMENDNFFYFFNPFTVPIFRRVIDNIRQSIENKEREIKLILYYPDDEYVAYLSDESLFTLENEIILPEYKKDPYEKFLIYSLKNK